MLAKNPQAPRTQQRCVFVNVFREQARSYNKKNTTMSTAHSTASLQLAEHDRTHRLVTWRLMPLLLVCYLFAHLDRINIGFAKMQMSSDLHFSDTVYGFGAGLFFIAYALFGVPSNIALDRVGPRRWIACLCLLYTSPSPRD